MSKYSTYGLNTSTDDSYHVLIGVSGDLYYNMDNKPIAVPNRGYYFSGDDLATVVDNIADPTHAVTNIHLYVHITFWYKRTADYSDSKKWLWQP